MCILLGAQIRVALTNLEAYVPPFLPFFVVQRQLPRLIGGIETRESILDKPFLSRSYRFLSPSFVGKITTKRSNECERGIKVLDPRKKYANNREILTCSHLRYDV